MAQNSSIEWTDHTFNPWWGCSKVSPACDNCYAELWAKRMGHKVWGSATGRRFFSDAHWNEPLTWNEDARIAHRRKRVFCASMADVFERRAELHAHRERLWRLIEATPDDRAVDGDDRADRHLARVSRATRLVERSAHHIVELHVRS